MVNSTIFGPYANEYLMSYEDATKVDVWRKDMDGEICTIEKVQTRNRG